MLLSPYSQFVLLLAAVCGSCLYYTHVLCKILMLHVSKMLHYWLVYYYVCIHMQVHYNFIARNGSILFTFPPLCFAGHVQIPL